VREAYEIPLPLKTVTEPQEFDLDLDGRLLAVVTKIIPSAVSGADGKPQVAVQVNLVVEGVKDGPETATKLLLTPLERPVPEGYVYQQLLWLPTGEYLLVYTRAS
jgi:hypothetical protein